MHECGCCAFIMSFILPPLAVAMVSGCGGQFCLNILLTLLGGIPGMVHAWYVICCMDDVDHRQVVIIQQHHTVPQSQPASVVVHTSSQSQPGPYPAYNPEYPPQAPSAYPPLMDNYQQPPPPYPMDKPPSY